jgi:hypothetical protein
MKKRVISLLIAVLIVLLPACAQSTDDKDTQNAGDSSGSAVDSSVEAAETERLYPDLPDKNYNNEAFTILVSSNNEYGTVKDDFTAEEMNAEPINDARYVRNTTVEDKFGVDIKVIQADLGSDVGYNLVKTSVTSGDFAYDFAMVCGYAACKLATQNYLLDLKKVPYIGLDKPWWDQKANSDLTVFNHLFYTTGDISTADNEATYCIMFNKNLITDLRMEDPYELVRTGKWTIDKYIEMAGSVSTDLDGDGKYTKDDQYGALIWDDTMMGIVNAAGEKCSSVENGEIKLTLNSEKTVTMIEKFFSFAFDKTRAYTYQRYNWDDKLLCTMFMNNQALFINQLMQLIPKLREMNADFGIIPYFKYDEAQKEYYNTVGSWHSVFLCVPKVQKDVERTGIVIEALAAESKYTVTPAYYDITLKTKAARDEESGEMLDLIFQTRIYDLGWYYQFGNYNESVMNLLRNFQNEFTSMYKRTEKAAQKMIDKTNEAFREADTDNG